MAANVAYHFAIALLRSAGKTGEIEEVRRDLGAMVALMAAERQVVYFLLHPLVPLARKEEFLRAACDTETARRTLIILLETKNLNLVREVYLQFSELARKEMGVVRAEVRTATGLGSEDEARLCAAITQMTSKQVEMEATTDPGILAGVWMRIGDKVIDNTLRTELKMARARLIS
jgi:F-type H+-transporting ATPase subunit delta